MLDGTVSTRDFIYPTYMYLSAIFAVNAYYIQES